MGPVEEVGRVSLDALKVELTRFPEMREVGNGRKKRAKVGPKDFLLS